MGRLNRYESNVMTYVRASNYKLIDRAARMVKMLKPEVTYE
jgi:N-acetylmuramic acid 6-phosphate (MurNAc-6-P) etherase